MLIKTPLSATMHLMDAAEICDNASVTLIAKCSAGQLTKEVGMPEMVPESEIDRPAGKDPPVTANV